MEIRVLMAGGGTSGHINPAVAIADEIKAESPDSVIEFCGTSRGLENDIVPRAGYVMHPIRARGVPSKPSLKMIKAVSDFAAGRKTCMNLIRSFKPDVVIGTGGYVCSPLVSAAVRLHIPVLLHEQNAFPGRSNRLMSRNADVVCTSFPGMEEYFPHAKSVVFTGNPVKRIFFDTVHEASRKKLGIPDGTFFLLAMGGSLGSRTINESVLSLAERIGGKEVKIVLSAGKQQYASLCANPTANDKIDIREYIYDQEIYMSAADLLIVRAGAITCAEVAALGAPSVMIPYPFAAGDHQTYNARAFEKEGACILLKDSDVTPELLFELATDLKKDRPRLCGMGTKAAGLSRPDAVRDIVKQVFALAANDNTGKGRPAI